MPSALLYNVGPIVIAIAFLAFLGSRNAKTRNIIYLVIGTASVVIAALLLASSQIRSFVIMGVCGTLLLVAGSGRLTGLSLWGLIDHEQVTDPRTEDRVRDRYGLEIRQLASLGFNYAFTVSEVVSPFRLLLVFPAIALVTMAMKGEVLAIGSRGKITFSVPIFCSADARTFAHPFGLGVKFQTAFRNGRLLITKTFKADCCETPEFVVLAAKSTISEAWRTHEEWLGRLDTEANPANRVCSYQVYVSISRRENDFLVG